MSAPHAADLPSDNVRAAAAHSPVTPAAITQPHRDELALSGSWTALGIGTLDRQLDALPVSRQAQIVVDGARVEALDTVGVWVLQRLLERMRGEGSTVRLNGWRPKHTKLLDLLAQHAVPSTPVPSRPRPALERLGRATVTTLEQISALLSFVGESAAALAGSVAHPARVRWRTILHDIQSAGFNALPIVGLLSFLLGIVVAYQGAEQLRRYGANVFVADLVGWSMLREFAPLMTAIIVAGRSGSAYAAQIGTMAVTEEIDAMRTLGIAPLDVLVLPKILALLIALPLLTVYADVLGVFGGMIMARAQLGVGYGEFLDRLVNAIQPSTYWLGVGKAPVFAAIIAVVGCFQGFRTHGGADSVGRQTTRAVVQAIFLVIVADALFSILFSILDF
jgi:phospholipid/cholesterol/gamma-HCH transport system permease protein